MDKNQKILIVSIKDENRYKRLNEYLLENDVFVNNLDNIFLIKMFHVKHFNTQERKIYNGKNHCYR